MRYQPKHRKYRKRGKRRSLRLLLGGLFVVTFCISTYMLVKELIQAEREKAALSELSAIVAEAKEQETPQAQTPPPREYAPEPIVIHVETAVTVPPATPIPTPTPAPVPLPQYAHLYEQNADFFGWITIEGTLIDYPVMYSPDRPEYYLKRAFDGTESASGSLFIDGECPADGNSY